MIERLAYFISFILNPLFILVFLPFFLVYKSTGSISDAIGWTAYSFMFLLAVGLFMIHGVKKKLFTDLDVSKREQRPLLFTYLFVVGILYVAGLYVFNAPDILSIMAIGMMSGLLIVSIVNRWIKASIHISILSALVLGVAFGYGGLSYLFFILIPLVAWSRVKIKRHTIMETLVGFIIGSLVSFGIFTYLKSIFT